eukprot:Rhum_TRINITY_DN13664_c1_g1::Rhum_TRINITY_DN13664_c1_g1_i1::g.62569::m.62569
MSWWSTPLTMSDALTAVGGVFSELVDDVEDTLDGMLGAPATPTTTATAPATPVSTRGEQEGEAGEGGEEDEDTAAPCTPTPVAAAAAATSAFSAASPLRTPCAARGGGGGVGVVVDEAEVSRLVGAIQAAMCNGRSGGGGVEEEEPASIDAVCGDIEMELAVEGAVLEATLVAMGAAAVRCPEQHDHFVERLDAVTRLAVITLESPSVPQTPSPTKLAAAASTADGSYSCKMYSQTAHLKRAVETLLRNM